MKSMLKLATSALVLSAAVVGGTSGQAMRPGNGADAKVAKQAQADADRAQRLTGRGQAREAVGFAEAAVAAAPRNVEYRMLLAQVYLAAGRLTSAETSFADTLTLDPERQRAALNLALVQTALGKRSDAMRTLADYHDKIPAADFGLAVALAGDPAAAVGILETAARDANASPKTRQNLALAYAMAGQWARARATAQQDLDPAVADKRVLGWASFTSPTNSWDQVASLLGVTPVEDAGQPTRLALGGTPAVVASLAPVPTPAPEQVAFAEPAPPPMASPSAGEDSAFEVPASVPSTRRDGDGDAAVSQPVPAPPVIRAPRPAAKTSGRPARPVRTVRADIARPPMAGRFVVQLGAFANASNAQRAWGGVTRRLGLGGYEPLSGTTRVANANLVRLAVSGFATRADADRMCGRIKASRGVCFVRAQSGDALAAWAKRGQPVRMASR